MGLHAGSEIEKEDIKKYYVKGKGSFIEIFEHVFFANVVDDEERIRNIVEKCIEDGELERIPEPKGYAQKWKRYLAKVSGTTWLKFEFIITEIIENKRMTRRWRRKQKKQRNY